MRKKRNRKKKRILFIIIFLFVIVGCGSGIFLYKNHLKDVENEKHIELIKNIRNSYNNFVITNKDTNLYDKDDNVIGSVSKDVYLVLDDIDEDYEKETFKLKYSDYYIKYSDIKKSDEQSIDTRYKNYILFNKSVKIDKNVKLYVDDNTYYTINKENKLPVIVDDSDKYYVEFDNRLVYVNKDDVEVVEEDNSSDEVADGVAVLNYHFVINKEAGEDKLCEPSSICHTDTQFESHVKYIKDNGYYSITMKELEMFIDGKINLPKKSVAITIDDGWFVARSKQILNDNEVMGTLFLIGYLAPVSDYASPYLEVHSHTWNLHNVSNCSQGRSPLLCYDKDEIVEDLTKSRESLDNTTYFCYPFYEYNDNAINALKEAGFTMALTDGNKKAKKGIDKYKVPRYVIFNTTTVSELESYLN